MGDVYTVDAVQKGHIPTLESFTEVTEHLEKGFRKCPAVLAATLVGGFLRSEHNRRSRICCVAVFSADLEHRMAAEWKRAGEFARRRHLRVDFVPIRVDPALTPMHRTGPIFKQCIADAIEAGGGIKGNILDHLDARSSVATEARECLCERAYKLEVGRSVYVQYTDEGRVAYLTEVLETAMRTARVMTILHGNVKSGAKCDVSRRYSDAVPSKLRDHFTRLQHLDERYSKVLHRQLEEGVDCNEYQGMLDEIEKHIVLAVRFAHENVEYVAGPRL